MASMKNKVKPAERHALAGREAPLVVVCEDHHGPGPSIAGLCERLGMRVETLTGSPRLFEILHYMQPAAVISAIVLREQDGFDVMKMVAGYHRDLPLLMLTGDDPILQGAVDAIEEAWQLTNVWRLEGVASVGTIQGFLASNAVIDPGPEYSVPGRADRSGVDCNLA